MRRKKKYFVLIVILF